MPVNKNSFLIGGSQISVVTLRRPRESAEERLGAIVDLREISGGHSVRGLGDDVLESDCRLVIG